LSDDAKLLQVNRLVAGYGKKEILRGVSLDVRCGEIVAVIGHNGAGKSTLLKAIFGVLPLQSGEVWLGGKRVLNVRPIALLKSGVAYVPQGNRVFGDLTVRDNLEIGGTSIVDRVCDSDAVERVLDLFPLLRHRLNQRAGTLSGGERQMLALANAFIISPRLLLIDEPSLGLATALVEEVLKQICQVSSARRTGVLIVEQKIRKVIKVASRVLVIRNGEVSFDGPTAGLDEAQLQLAYL